MRVFFDTNILVDLLTDARPRHPDALRIMSKIVSNEFQVVITPLTLANAEYIIVAHHKLKDFKARIEEFREHRIISIMNQTQAEKAIVSNWSDFEDALQYQSSIEAKCDVIITRDIKGFKKSKIKVLTPEEFLDEY